MIDSGDVEKACEKLVRLAVENDADGLAAPQIGIPMRLVAINKNAKDTSSIDAAEEEAEKDPSDYMCILNPSWAAVTDEVVGGVEVCLSVPGLCATVKRFNQIKLSGASPKGEPISMMMRGWPARVVQHECDHLDGVNFIERMEPKSLSTYEYGIAQMQQNESESEETSASRIEVQ